MSVYQLPSPPTQQPVNKLPYDDMAKSTKSQVSTPKEATVNKLPGGSKVTTNGQPIKVNSKSAVNGVKTPKTISKKKSGALKIDTSVVSKSTPVSPTSQSSSPQPTSASSTGHSPRPKSNANNTFVHKLYQMLSDPKQSNYIKWNDTGLSFTIRNTQGFSRSVLPLHFRHNNFSSFVRQLNMYGFHKVNKSSPSAKGEHQVWEFYHPKFIRGKPQLIEEIKRRQMDNENYRANLIIEQTKILARQNSAFFEKANLARKPSTASLNGVTTTGTPIAVSTQLIPGQGTPMMNMNGDFTGQNAVFIQSTEGIPATNVAVAVTSSGETVLIDPAVIQNTPHMSMVQSVPVPPNQTMGNYGVIQVPSQPVPYNDVNGNVSYNEINGTPSGNATPVPTPMNLGNVMPPNPQAMVDPAHVVVNGHTILPPEVPSVPGQPQPPMENDVYYNIQLLQMQNQDMNQRLNDLQMNVNNLMDTYTRRMDMQQNLIQQLMSSTQAPMPSNPPSNPPSSVCSVDQGQALGSSMMSQGATMVNGNMVTPSPVVHHQMLHQSPVQSTQVLVQPPNGYNAPPPSTTEVLDNYSSPAVTSDQSTPSMIKQESVDQYSMNNSIQNSVGYPSQTVYY